jgi:hypothetical protein
LEKSNSIIYNRSDGKKLELTLGLWTVNHSRSVRWNAYRSKDNKVESLLQDVPFFSDDGYSNLWEIVHESEDFGYLLAVSDGSVKFHDMSFGWILATPTGKRLVAAAGPCNGRGNSLRAEGAGMLSATIFIALIKHYLKIETMKIVFISDNSELIRRLKVHKQYVAADKYAGYFQLAKGKFRPVVSLLPSCDAMLSIRGISVTSNYRKQLIRAYVEPEYIQYLQYRFEWPNETIEIIAWKCLSLAIQQINRDVSITKVCNDLLPTADTLCKMKYQHHDTCILCHQHKTRDHIIRCTAPSQIKLRQQYICALWTRLETIETEFALKEPLSTAIVEWLETGEVNVSNYPVKYENAILSQERIGWQHFFAGKISQGWLKLPADSTHKTIGKKRDCYVWGASIVEITLKYFIKLWEQRNGEVHGKTTEQYQTTRKTKLSINASKLNSMKDKARPVDMGLFHADIKSFLDNSTAQTIATFISSHRKAITNSVKKYMAASQEGVTSVVQWISGWSNNDEIIEKMHAQQRKDLLETDGWKKERRRRGQPSNVRQKSIVGFMSLMALH